MEKREVNQLAGLIEAGERISVAPMGGALERDLPTGPTGMSRCRREVSISGETVGKPSSARLLEAYQNMFLAKTSVI